MVMGGARNLATLAGAREHAFEVVAHHRGLEAGVVEDLAADVGVVIHSLDDALHEGVGENEPEVLDRVGARLGDKLLVVQPRGLQLVEEEADQRS